MLKIESDEEPFSAPTTVNMLAVARQSTRLELDDGTQLRRNVKMEILENNDRNNNNHNNNNEDAVSKKEPNSNTMVLDVNSNTEKTAHSLQSPMSGQVNAIQIQPIFQCADCGKTTNSQRNLQRHRVNCKIYAAKRQQIFINEQSQRGSWPSQPQNQTPAQLQTQTLSVQFQAQTQTPPQIQARQLSTSAIIGAEFQSQQKHQQQRFYYSTTPSTINGSTTVHAQAYSQSNYANCVDYGEKSAGIVSSTVLPSPSVASVASSSTTAGITLDVLGDTSATAVTKKRKKISVESSTTTTTHAANSTTGDFECEACHKSVSSSRSLKRHRSTCKVLQSLQSEQASPQAPPPSQMAQQTQVQSGVSPHQFGNISAPKILSGGNSSGTSFSQSQMPIQAQQQMAAYQEEQQQQQSSQQKVVDVVDSVVNRLRKQSTTPQAQPQSSTQGQNSSVVPSEGGFGTPSSSTESMDQSGRAPQLQQITQNMTYPTAKVQYSGDYGPQGNVSSYGAGAQAYPGPYVHQNYDSQQQMAMQQRMMQQQHQHSTQQSQTGQIMRQVQQPQVQLQTQQAQVQQRQQTHMQTHQSTQQQIFHYNFAPQSQFQTAPPAPPNMQVSNQSQTHQAQTQVQQTEAKPESKATAPADSTKAKPVYRFLCPECDKQYSCRKNIKRHRMSVHKVPLEEAQKSDPIQRIRLSDEEAAALAAQNNSRKKPAASDATIDAPPALKSAKFTTAAAGSAKTAEMVMMSSYGSGDSSSGPYYFNAGGPGGPYTSVPMQQAHVQTPFSAPPIFEENKGFPFGASPPMAAGTTRQDASQMYYGGGAYGYPQPQQVQQVQQQMKGPGQMILNQQHPYQISNGVRSTSDSSLPRGAPQMVAGSNGINGNGGVEAKYPQVQSQPSGQIQIMGYAAAQALENQSQPQFRSGSGAIYRHNSFDAAHQIQSQQSQYLYRHNSALSGCSSAGYANHLADLDFWDQIKSDVDRPFVTRSRADDLEMARIAEDLKRSAEGEDELLQANHNFSHHPNADYRAPPNTAPPYLTSLSFPNSGPNAGRQLQGQLQAQQQRMIYAHQQGQQPSQEIQQQGFSTIGQVYKLSAMQQQQQQQHRQVQAAQQAHHAQQAHSQSGRVAASVATTVMPVELAEADSTFWEEEAQAAAAQAAAAVASGGVGVEYCKRATSRSSGGGGATTPATITACGATVKVEDQIQI